MIRVYFHVAGMNHYREIVAELAGMIDASGLYDHATELRAMTVGSADVSHLFGDKWGVEVGSLVLDDFEFPTLQELHRTALEFPHDHYLYIHTKGASQPGRRRKHRETWRRYMAYFVISRWQECVSLLANYNAVGTDWLDSAKWHTRHFAGNFWWARGDYLATLPIPQKSLGENQKGVRYGAELWIGLGDIKYKSLHSIGSKYLHRPHVFPEAYRGASIAD